MLIAPLNLTNEQLKDRAVCFELFRKSYRKNQALEENKEILKEKFAQAKQVGNLVNNSRNEINRLKNQVYSCNSYLKFFRLKICVGKEPYKAF